MEENDALPRKRPRINRACAACRRRKIKCDGSQPCKACTTNELICSYDEDERRRNGPEYIQTLEKKVEELELLLGHQPHRSDRGGSLGRYSSMGHSNRYNSDMSSKASSTQRGMSRTQSSGFNSHSSSVRPSPSRRRSQTSKQSYDDDVVEAMGGTSENESSSEERYWGHFGGLSLLQRMRKLCSSVAGMHQSSQGDSVEDDFVSAFDSASPANGSSGSWDAFAILPSRDRLMECINITLEQACCLLDFIDRSSVEGIVRHIYDTDSFDYTAQDRKMLALLFAMMAVGRRFEVENGDSTKLKNNISKGLRYFRASRSILDVADCHDIISLQTVLCLVIYLQASSMLSTCYSYICAAVAASLRMGLHSPAILETLSPDQRRIRRCIFSVINIMDTYVTTSLGLPRTLRDVDSESVVPIPQPSDSFTPVSFFLPEDADISLTATNAHAKLIHIMARAIDSHHPLNRPPCQQNGFYTVEYHRIVAVEEELEAWYNALPASLTFDSNDDIHKLRCQLLLRMAYAHVQMVLYRPFLHHAAKIIRPAREVRYKSYACGSACVKAAMQVAWLAEALEVRGLFNEACWFVALGVSFAATILMLFVLSNEGNDTIKAEAEAAEKLKNLLMRHADRSLSARRSSKFLQELIDTKRKGTKHPYDDLSGYTDETFRTPRDPRTEGSQQEQHEDTHDQDVTMNAETRTEEGQQPTLQALSYPPMSQHFDVNQLDF
ncbi:hypothetical protein AAFC00_005205 [Neodothiora populina]|uniref:Zn(2)-C6 fungal-type domain-containing protein n=1 Tax=Neodothiora populina TaxID=2781224 RepID=A0ABR3PK45_9PEZI